MGWLSRLFGGGGRDEATTDATCVACGGADLDQIAEAAYRCGSCGYEGGEGRAALAAAEAEAALRALTAPELLTRLVAHVDDLVLELAAVHRVPTFERLEPRVGVKGFSHILGAIDTANRTEAELLLLVRQQQVDALAERRAQLETRTAAWRERGGEASAPAAGPILDGLAADLRALGPTPTDLALDGLRGRTKEALERLRAAAPR